MILNRKYYSQMSFLRSWWTKQQFKKLRGEKLFKIFRLHKTEWPTKIYFYSPRLRRIPEFSGNRDLLNSWKEAKVLESICPTYAIRVTSEAVQINRSGCIACNLCVEYAPHGLLVTTTDLVGKVGLNQG